MGRFAGLLLVVVAVWLSELRQPRQRSRELAARAVVVTVKLVQPPLGMMEPDLAAAAVVRAAVGIPGETARAGTAPTESSSFVTASAKGE